MTRSGLIAGILTALLLENVPGQTDTATGGATPDPPSPCRQYRERLSEIVENFQKGNGDLDDGMDDNGRERERRLYQAAGAGPAILTNVSAGSVALNVYYGALWELNSQVVLSATAKASSDFTDAIVLSGVVGGRYFILNTRIRPFAAGDIGLGWVNAQAARGLGLDAGAGLGADIFDLEAVRIRVAAHASILFNQIENAYPLRYIGTVGVVF